MTRRVPQEIFEAYLDAHPILPDPSYGTAPERAEWFWGLVRAAYAVGYNEGAREAQPTGVHGADPERRKWAELQRVRATRLFRDAKTQVECLPTNQRSARYPSSQGAA